MKKMIDDIMISLLCALIAAAAIAVVVAIIHDTGMIGLAGIAAFIVLFYGTWTIQNRAEKDENILPDWMHRFHRKITGKIDSVE